MTVCSMTVCSMTASLAAAHLMTACSASQALTGVPASDNVRGWRGSIPLGVLPSGSSSSASSSEMVCALPSNSRSLASHQALCARAPLALAGPLTNGAWALACADHRPDHRRRHRRRRHHQRRFRRRHRCCAHASVHCGCACRQPVREMRTRPNGPLRMASALAACVSALFQPTSTRWYVCCRVGMTFEFSGLTEL